MYGQGEKVGGDVDFGGGGGGGEVDDEGRHH